MAETERALGDLWAEARRARGDWVVKLPASSTAGIPDWLLADGNGVVFVEAKRREGGPTAFRPRQLTVAQRYFLEQVVLHGGRAGVVVLGSQGYVELTPDQARRPLTRYEYEAMEVPYDG